MSERHRRTSTTPDAVPVAHGGREGEERYRALVHACPSPIVVHAGGVVLFVNPAALELFGARSPEQVVGRPVMQFVHPEFRSVVAERMTKMLETGEPSQVLEEKILRLDGSVRDVEIAGAAVTFRGGRAIQLVGRDVTERRLDEERRRRIAERVREARRRDAMMRLGGGIARTLQELSEELLDSVDACIAEGSTAIERPLRAMRRVGLRMKELTEQLQHFVGSHDLPAGRVDLASIVLELSERLEAQSGAASLGFELPSGLPPVRADVRALRRIVTALVHNAVDAVANGGGNVAIRALALRLEEDELAAFEPADSLAPGNWVALEVRDTGCGMDEETRAKVFEPFFTTKAPGRGLALAEVLGLVGALRGGIRVQSARGEGTTVTVILPPAPANPPPSRPGRSARTT